jgi:hypothetical protein
MTPYACPACRERVVAHSLRCVACGVALGEGNRCGRCLAIAPVFERTGRYVCSACGETRTRHDDTVVTTEAALLQAFEAARGRALPRFLLALTGLALLGLIWSAMHGAAPRWLALPTGVLLIFEQRIIGLAFRNDGLLTASAVSTTLRISRSEAHELLGELASSGRARAESQEGGSDTTYFFGEAKRTRGLRGRLSSPP